MLQGHVLVDEHQRDLAAEQVLHHRAAAAVRDADHEETVALLDPRRALAGLDLEQFHRHVARRGVREAVVQLARVLAHELDQLLEARERRARVHHQHVGAGVHLRQVHEVAHRVVAELGVQAVCDRALANAGLHDGVAVRCHLGCAQRADGAAGAADVLDDDLLAELLAERFGHHAGHHVAGAAGRERADQLDRFARPAFLRQRRHGDQSQCDSGGAEYRATDHRGLLGQSVDGNQQRRVDHTPAACNSPRVSSTTCSTPSSVDRHKRAALGFRSCSLMCMRWIARRRRAADSRVGPAGACGLP